MAQLKPGSRLESAVCATQVITVRAPEADLDIRCGGVAMIEPGGEGGGDAAEGFTGGTELGKRYVDADDELELLCTKAGEGALSIGDTLLTIKSTEQLPASD